ncbi:YheC/YheD family protein [Alkalihalobacterium chitinilyticum]|uniref:YheC/YheD family protein n=1 Tax=Alkalihalobacterium chitinilyticum TaxID=2980103 RepID=A0ABT5VBG1_9BACI|nr:YheC/YheD family protein [Alkalihalobacterium chitinilyticum]MDE5412682.1 YheC/YheD family protein [Alkalihalobacterium chitinilyticum]
MKGLDKPTLGICVGRKENKKRKAFLLMVRRRLVEYKNNHFKDVIVFTMDKLSLSNFTVTGERFHWSNEEIMKETGTYPLPDVVYIQSEFHFDELQALEKVLPGKVFNNHFYTKYECIEILSKNNYLRPHIPETSLLGNLDDLHTYTKKFNQFYLKPVKGHSGEGIYYIELLGNGNVNCVGKREKFIFDNCSNLVEWFQQYFQPNIYMVQEAITTKKWKEDKSTDIRLNMNKNGNGVWEVSFLVGRIAMNKVFVAAGAGNNVLIYIDHLLKQLFSDKSHEIIKKSIIDLGYSICKTFDKTKYNMGDLGIDLGMDNQGKLWIFEVNHLPHPFHKLNDKSLTLPFEYAYFLTQKKGNFKEILKNLVK